MIKISLSEEYTALIDEEDAVKVLPHRWHASVSIRAGEEKVYAITVINKKTVYMHRLILDAPQNLQVDHKDNNGLNNLRENLRLATVSQQAGNTRSKGGSSKFKGVYWHSQRGYPGKGLWAAVLNLPGGKVIKKYFHSEDDAARKYNEMAIEHFGEFAKLNEVV